MMQISKTILLVFGTTLSLQLFPLSSCENYYSEIGSLTQSQRKTLDAFKTSMLPILPKRFMKEDIFLINFLKFNNFNIPKSERHLKEALQWREENNVDQILANPPAYFAALNKEFPIFNDGFDKEGRPICEVPLGRWPVRKAAAAGHIKNVTIHMMVNCAERALERVREQQAKGKNVTQFVFLANLEGFSLIEHACPACLPLVVNLASGNDKYFPNGAYGFWLTNTPPQFAVVFRIARPLLSTGARAAFKVFTSDESQWKPFLEKNIDLNEIGDMFGGAKTRRIDV